MDETDTSSDSSLHIRLNETQLLQIWLVLQAMIIKRDETISRLNSQINLQTFWK